MAILSEMANNLRTLHASTSSEVQRLKTKYLQYMKKSKDMCRSVWAKFDISLMLIGCLQVLFTILLQTTSTLGVISSPFSKRVLLSQTLLTLTSLALVYLSILPAYSMVILTFLSMLILVCCSSKELTATSLSAIDIFSIISLVMLGLCSLSNSLVVYEDRATYFILQSVLTSVWLRHILEFVTREQSKVKERTNRPATYIRKVFRCSSTYIFLSLSFLLKLSQIFQGCREEQTECEVSLFFSPLSSVHDEFITYKNTRFWLMSVPAAVLPVMAANRVLTVRGHLNGSSPLTIFSLYILPIMSFLIILDWTAGSTEVLADWQRTMFARAVYISVIVCIGITFVWPKAVYFTASRSTSIPYNGSVPSLYNYMKKNLDEKQEQRRPLVYGLGTVYSASYVIMSTAIALVLIMIAGDGMALSVFLLLITAYLFLDLHRDISAPQCEYEAVLCYSFG